MSFRVFSWCDRPRVNVAADSGGLKAHLGLSRGLSWMPVRSLGPSYSGGVSQGLIKD